jgi:hypothetical protein
MQYKVAGPAWSDRFASDSFVPVPLLLAARSETPISVTKDQTREPFAPFENLVNVGVAVFLHERLSGYDLYHWRECTIQPQDSLQLESVPQPF